MPQPKDPNKRLAILMLRALDCTHEEIAQVLGIGKPTSIATEKRFISLKYEEARELCRDSMINIAYHVFLLPSPVFNKEKLTGAARLSTDYILRRFEKIGEVDPIS